MSETPSRNIPAGAEGPGDPGEVRPRPRRRRGLRIALISMASFVVLIGAVAAGGYAYLNHMAGSIQRIPVKFTRLTAAGGYYDHMKAMNVLITGAGFGPTGSPSPVNELSDSGLIMILHVNADQYSGGVVSIPPQSIVRIPGHGKGKLEDALKDGGPSLLVQTIENLTHVQINHYARIDFNHVANVVNVMGGVDVTLPDTTDSFGHFFHLGVNHLNGITALDYVREPNLSEEGRVLRQQNLIRAVIRKLYLKHLLSNPLHVPRAPCADQHAHGGQQLHQRRARAPRHGDPQPDRHLDLCHGPGALRGRDRLPGPRDHRSAVGRHPAGLDRGVRQEVPVHRDPAAPR